MKNDLDLRKITQIFFYLLLIVLPFNARHIFNFSEIQNLEGFREHLTQSFYAFDLVFVLLLFSFLLLWVKNSRNSTSASKNSKNPLIWFVLTIVIASFLAINQVIAFQQTLRIFQGVLLFFVASFLFRDKKIFHASVLIIFLSGVFQSLLGITQFVTQKSLGLKFLGESQIAPNILGVAKFEIMGEKMIRAYGTFPHPNLLAAFLLLSLACGFWLLIHKKELSEKFQISLALLATGYGLLVTAIVFTYSRSVILATFLLILLLGLAHRKRIWSFYSGCCKKMKIHNFLQGALGIILIFAFLFVFYGLAAPRLCVTKCHNDNSIEMRGRYSHVAIETIKKHPVFGVGPGNFVPHSLNIYRDISRDNSIHPWELQPVHNLYLLVAAETGLVGLVTFLAAIFSVLFLAIKKPGQPLELKSQFKNPFFVLALLFFLLALVDHYFWTLTQGILLFWLSLAFLQGSSKMKAEL